MARRRDSIAEELEAEGVPGLDDSDPAVEGQIPPRDHPQGASEYGVTAREQAGDEPLAERALRERPDIEGDDGDEARSTGRILAPDEGDLYQDEEKDEVAREADDDAGLSAEEQAVHETDNP